MAAYCTVEEVKDPGRLNITSEEYDISLFALCEAASRWIDRHLEMLDHAFLVSADRTIYLNSDHVRGRILRLRQPCLSVTSIVNGNAVSVPVLSTRLLPRNEEAFWQLDLFSTHSWVCGPDQEIAITGKFGFSETPPAPVAEAARMLATWLFKRYQTAMQEQTANYDLGQVSYSDAMPKAVTSLLEPIRLKLQHWKAYA